MTTEAPGRLEDPYVGPVSFRLGDPLYGRDREREDLLDLLIAERIVLLYSPSGAGKSSLIEAALVPELREAAFEVLPTIRVTHTLPPEPGMPVPRNRYVMGVLLSLEEGVPPERQRPVAELATLTLREYLAAYADRDKRPGNEVLIFDQFEEVLTADPTDEPLKHAFFKELGDVLRDRGHWALFSMREDFLAALDPYLKYLPTRLRTTYRLDLLSVPEALEAIRRPAQRVGVDFTEEAALQLVDDLRTVRVQRPSGITEVLGSYVEPVQLQVACHLLWSMLPPYSSRISSADVEALGQVDQALAGYYAERVQAAAYRSGVPEQVVRDWFEEKLITPQGLRSQVLQGPVSSAEAGHALLSELLDAHLVRAETRRQATWYELAHDRLIEPIRRDNAAWRTGHLTSLERAAILWEQEGKPDRLLFLGADLAAAEQDESVWTGALTSRQREFLDASRRADEQERRDAQTAATLRRSARRLRITVALTTLLAVASVILLVFSVLASIRAERQEVAARLLLDAQRNLSVDQDFAVALAAKGAETYPSSVLPGHVRDVLYRAASSPVSLVFRGQESPSRSAAISEDGRVLVVAGSEDISIWDRETGRFLDRLALDDGDDVRALDVTDDGQTVMAGTMSGSLLVWDVDSDQSQRWEEGSNYVWNVAHSPASDSFASVGGGTEIMIWGFDGERQLTLDDPRSSYYNSVDYSPDGKMLATVGDGAEVVLWDAESGAQLGQWTLPEPAWSVVFGGEGDAVATITASAVTVWDLATQKQRFDPLLAGASGTRNVDEDLSRALSVTTAGQVSVYDLASGLEVASSSVPGASSWGAGFDTDPSRVLVLGRDVDPAFWKLRPAGPFAEVTAASMSDDRTFEAWSDGTIAFTSEGVGRGETPDQEIRAGERIFALASDVGGERLVGVTNLGEARVWDTTERTELFSLEPGEFPYWDADLTPDGTLLVTGNSNGDVSTWDVGSGAKVNDIIIGEGRTVSDVQVSPDGSTVLVALQPPSFFPDPRVALVVPLEGGDVTALELPAGGHGSVTAAAFALDGETVILGTSTGHVARLDPASGKSLWPDEVDPHQGEVAEVLVEDDGSVITTGFDRKTVLLDADGTEILQMASASQPLIATRVENGSGMALVTVENGAVSFPLDDETLLDLVDSKLIYHLPASVCRRYALDGC